MNPAHRLDTIQEYYFSQKLREIELMNQEQPAVINLGIGSPDLPPHPDVIRVLNESSQAGNVHAYQSYKGSKALRQAMAAWYRRWYGVGLDPETELLPLMGSKEGILHICMTYLNEGDEALVPNPGYPTYRSAVTLAGGQVRHYDLAAERSWMPDLEALEKEGLEKVKIMWVNYPQMPTGQLPTRELFQRLVDFGRRHRILICHDNPYSFILNKEPMSLLSVEGALDVALELNSLSKSHNMAGWRVGMLGGSRERIEEVLRFKSNMDSGMFLPLQLAAARALELGEDWHEGLNAIYARRRERAFELLDHLQCTYSKEQAGMFVWASIPDSAADGYALSDAILHRSRVFLTPGGIFGPAGTRYLRVSLCSPEEKIAEALERIKKSA